VPWVLFFGGLWLLLALHLGLLAVGSHLSKMQPDAIVFGVGPKVLERKIGALQLRLCGLPLGGSVTTKVEDASVGQRMVPVALANVLLTALGIGVLGLPPALAIAKDAVVLPFSGAISPGVDAQQTIARVVNAVAAGDYPATFGASAVALGVFNLLLGTATAVSTLHRTLTMVVSFLTIVLGLPWLYAWVVYLL